MRVSDTKPGEHLSKQMLLISVRKEKKCEEHWKKLLGVSSSQNTET